MPRGVARVTGRLAAPGRFVVAWWVTGGLGALDFSAAGESDCTHPGESLTRVIVWAKGDCYVITAYWNHFWNPLAIPFLNQQERIRVV